MKILDQLDKLNLDSAAKTQVAALVQSLLDQVKKEAEKYETDLQAKDLKIQALILELAHLRRLRYGVKTEALSSLQRDLFEEPATKTSRRLCPKSSRPVNKPVPPLPNPSALAPVVSPYLRICRVLNTAMNLNPVNVGSAVRTWSKLAKTSPNNWMSSPLSSLSIATSVRNMLAATVKPSLPHRFLRPSSTVVWRGGFAGLGTDQ